MVDEGSPERYDTYEALEGAAMARFAEADYEGALALLDAQAARFPANRANSAYLRACLHVRRGEEALAVETLRGAIDDGLWYSEPVLRQSPSLQPLQGNRSYESLVGDFASRLPAEASATEPAVARPAGTPHGVMVALHGNGQTARQALDDWQPLVGDGWMIVAPFSSQMLHSSGAVWDDAETARADVARQVADLDGLVPNAPTIVAGFSLGADVALGSVLGGILSTRRLLLIGPPALLVQDPAWSGYLEGAAGIRAHVLLGGEDAAVSAAAVHEMVDALRGAGAQVAFDVVEGIAHVQPSIEIRRAAIEGLARG